MNLVTVPGYLLHALSELQTAEIPGEKDNPRIVRYWNEAKISPAVNDDETAWCAAFVGAMLFRDGVEGTRKPNAKSYALWGHEWAGMGLGAVVVLHRSGNAPKWQGHVGFCVGMNASNVYVLGGNQGNKVSIAAFPRSRVMTIRQPLGIILPSSGFALPPQVVDPSQG